MLRFLLPSSVDTSLASDLTALDEALRRGELKWARQRLKLLVATDPTPEVILRSALVAYLVNEYDDARALLAQLPPDEARLHPYGEWLAALIAIDRRQSQQAQSILARLLAHWPENSIERSYIHLAWAISSVYQRQYDQADKHLTAIHLSGDDARTQWARYQQRRIAGILAHQRTRYLEAKAFLEEARSGFLSLDDRYETARCDYALANAFRRLDNYAQARRHAEQALDYFQQEEALVPLARCRSALANVQLYFNQPELALQNYQFALAYFRKAGLQNDQASMLHNIGVIHRQLGEFRMALQAYTQARTLVSVETAPDIVAHLEHSLAELSWHLGDRTHAIERLHHASHLFLQLGSRAHVSNIWRLLGQYAFILGDLDQAQEYLERSSRMFLELHRPAQAAITSILLARVIWAQGEQERAIQMLVTSAELLSQLFMPHQAAEALTWLATFYYEEHRLDEAKEAIERAYRLMPHDHYTFSWRVHFLMARLAMHSHHHARARDHLDQANHLLNRLRKGAMSPSAAAELGREAQQVLTLELDLALKEKDTLSALRSLETYKAVRFLERLLNGEAHAPSQGASDVMGTYAEKLARLRRAIQVARLDQNWERLETLEQTFDHLVQELDALQTSPLAPPLVPSWDIPTLRKSLDRRHGKGRWGTFIVGLNGQMDQATELYLFWLDSERLLSERRELGPVERQILALATNPFLSYRRQLLEWGQEMNPPRLWERLERLLLPSEFEKAMGDTRTIYLSSSGQLSLFPFFALRTHGIPLGLQKALSHIVSLPILQTLLRRPGAFRPLPPLSTMRGLICALSDFDHGHLPPLPETVREAMALFHHLSPESILLCNEEATLSAFREALHGAKGRPFDVVHFATHAYFHPTHATLSHLVLFDEHLYVPDIMSLSWQTDLVMLTACDTSVTQSWPGDELMGLSYAFIVGGAKRVIAALWPIPDEMGARFSEACYQHLQRHDSVAEALLATRLSLYAEKRSPFHWGAFSLYGLA